MVTLHRGHEYQSLEQVKDEVSAKALELSQDGLPTGRKVLLIRCYILCIFAAFDSVSPFQWPILAPGEGLGSRKVLFESSSAVSGKMVVEESEEEGGGGRVRRLVFLCTPYLSQTEVRIVPGKDAMLFTSVNV